MATPLSKRRSMWRRITAWYSVFLSWLVAISTAVLVIPVTLQIFSRFTSIIPHYIWTEEMARFLLVWTVMIGAMIGVRESTHFEVDVWPQLSPRPEAAVRLIARICVLIVALVFIWSGIEFTQFAWYRISELAELPLWVIHIAWPITGITWLVFLGEQMWDELNVLLGRVTLPPADPIPTPEGAPLMTGALLSPGQAALVLFGIFFGLMLLRVPVAFALALACLPILIIEPRLSAMTLVQETFNAYNSFILLAVPFFLLTANLMNVGGITERLMKLSRSMVGHFPGGLAQINVVLSFFFAGISGSSTADAASQSKIFIEAQRREGYDDSFSVAITAVSAVLAVIIPPSILMIVWGGVLTVSIGALFLAGVIPGLLIALAQMATVHAYATLKGYPTYPRDSWTTFFKSILASIPALMTPLIIIGGKIFGWFTATESACIAVLYAGFLSIFIYREMDSTAFREALVDTGKFAGITLFCVGTASAFGWLLAYYQIPKAILSGVSAWELGPIGTGFFIAFVFLVVGCFLDAIPAIIIVGTILEPLARSAGLDPVHFAMIGIVSLAFGLVTPPYGLCLMIACSVAGIRMRQALKDTMIMLVPMFLVLALLIVWPQVALFVPSLVSPEFLK